MPPVTGHDVGKKRAKKSSEVVRPAQPPSDAHFAGSDLAYMMDRVRDAKAAIKALIESLVDHSAVTNEDVVELLRLVRDKFCVAPVPDFLETGDVQPLLTALLAKVAAGGVVSDDSVSDKVTALYARLKKLEERTLPASQKLLDELTAKLENTHRESEYDTEFDELETETKFAEERVDGHQEWIKKIKAEIEADDNSKIKQGDVEALRTALGVLLHSFYEDVMDVCLRQDKGREILMSTR